MRKRVVPSHFQRDLQKCLETLKKDSMYVDDYFKAMDMAMIQANSKEDEEATMARFLNGLNGEVVDVVELQQYVNLDELVELAVKVEKQNKRKQQASSWKNLSTTTTRKPWPTHEEKSMPKSQDDGGKGKWEAKDRGKTFNTKISTTSTPLVLYNVTSIKGGDIRRLNVQIEKLSKLRIMGNMRVKKVRGKKKRVLGVRTREMWLLIIRDIFGGS
ncbi:hypothetical protein KY284_001447 [Solanum tuberosum]|nr:hypothetical protein KY284_001447 [Solanum tuberosum]